MDPEPTAGLFLLRRVFEGGRVDRILVARSSIVLDAWLLNQYLTVSASSDSGEALAGLSLQVLDRSGRVVAEGLKKGEGIFVFPVLRTKQAAFLKASWNGQSTYQNLRPHTLPGPRLVPGALWMQGTMFQPGATCSYFGLWWTHDESPEVEILDERGKVVDRFLLFFGESELFLRGEFKAPKALGSYSIRLVGSGELNSSQLDFTVSDLASESSYSDSLLTLVQQDDGLYSGTYDWEGPKGAFLDVRASLFPRFSAIKGWRLSHPDMPNWLNLTVNETETLDGGSFVLESIPELAGPWTLEVELYDSNSPESVIHRMQRDLGDESLKMTDAEIKVLSPRVRLGRFKFQFASGENGPQRGLKCRFLKQDSESDSGWRAVSEGQAIWREGSYEWSTSFEGSGVFRVECLFQGPVPDREEKVVTWERLLYSEAVIDGQEVLDVFPAVASPGESVRIRWPDLALGTPVWLSLLTDGVKVDTVRRLVDQEGNLGELIVPDSKPGQREVVLVAAIDSGQSTQERSVRTRVLPLDRRNLAKSLDFGFQSANGEGLVLQPGSSLDIPLQRGAHTLSEGMFWWSERDSESGPIVNFEESLREVDRRSFATILSSTLPWVGPLDLSEQDVIKIDSPSLPGHYKLNFLGFDSEGQIFVAEHLVSVKESSRWLPLVPLYLRPGDSFWAGVRFWASPDERTPVGTIASVSMNSSLRPLTFFTTAALVEPGKSADMLFSYQAPGFLAGNGEKWFDFEWELGVDGAEVPVAERVKSELSQVKEVLFRKRRLESGQRVRFDMSSIAHWKLKLSRDSDQAVSERANLTITGESLEDKNIDLEIEAPPHEFFGSDASELVIWQKAGSPTWVEAFWLQPRTEPDGFSSKELYLMRQLKSEKGTALQLNDVVMNQEYLASFHLLLPKAGQGDWQLFSPLPGGFEALGCWLKTEESIKALDWEYGSGKMSVRLPSVEQGEHEIIVSVKAKVAGNFHWPSSRILSAEGSVLAQTEESSVPIKRE